MRRVIVPLNGTADAASAIPNARRVLGSDGELLFVLDRGSGPEDEQGNTFPTGAARGEITLDIESVAMGLRAVGAKVRILETLERTANDLMSVASEYGADMVVCTRPRVDRRGELAWGGTLSRALAESPVPILLSPADEPSLQDEDPPPRLLVPLDDSEPAEAVLQVAEDLANEWGASLWLTHVLSAQATTREMARAWEYLRRIADDLACDTWVNVIAGRSVATMLIRTVNDWMITDVVMASGRRAAGPGSGLGSVAERLVTQLKCRIVLVPPSSSPSARPARGSVVRP